MLESEFTDCSDAINMNYIIKHDLQLITGCYISFTILIDRLLQFDILTEASPTTEICFKKSLKNVQCSYDKIELKDVVYIRSVFIIADAKTKTKKITVFSTYNENSVLDHLIQKWIVRRKKCRSSLGKWER